MGRPFTWIFSIGTAMCGAVMALKSFPPPSVFISIILGIGLCTTTAINVLNGIFDVKTDEINKPDRPLVQGVLNVNEAFSASALLYTASLIGAFMFGLWPFLFMSIGVLLSLAYSIPPVRLKDRGIVSNLSLAIGYCGITFLGGWSIFKTPMEVPLEVILVLVLMIVEVTGASVVKDFVDYEGDLKAGIKTVPVRFGIKRSVAIVSPLVLGVYFTIPLMVFLEIFEPQYLLVSSLSLWGIYILKELYSDLSKSSRKKMFVHIFFLALLTEFTFVAAYLC